MNTTFTTARAARIALIVDAAHVRDRLGQAALYELRNGEHVVIWHGERFTGETVDAAIKAAGRRSPA